MGGSPKPGTKPDKRLKANKTKAKPTAKAKTASKSAKPAAKGAAPKFGSPAWRAKFGK
jgi:hypothetical protein